jgi:mono/diheme cytochrome c family protein
MITRTQWSGALVIAALVSMAVSHASAVQLSPVSAAATSSASHRAVLDRYCVTCHNQNARTPAASPVELDRMDLSAVSSRADVWEKVVRKLRSGTMPPPGAPRPPADQAAALAAWLEGELDRAAAAHPDPGRVPAFHRLTRSEYRNAVRDLLALEDLPRELDVDLLLPADNTVGFDTVAEALFVTPTLLESYMTAARKLSAVAMGDPSLPLLVDTFRPGLELPQDDHVSELPLGTRGGAAIRRYFPLDGDYTVRVELAGRAREPHQLEISLDGERVKLLTIGGPAGDDESGPDVRLRVAAGLRTVGVTFVKRTAAPVESLAHEDGGQARAAARVHIAGNRVRRQRRAGTPKVRETELFFESIIRENRPVTELLSAES